MGISESLPFQPNKIEQNTLKIIKKMEKYDDDRMDTFTSNITLNLFKSPT